MTNMNQFNQLLLLSLRITSLLYAGGWALQALTNREEAAFSLLMMPVPLAAMACLNDQFPRARTLLLALLGLVSISLFLEMVALVLYGFTNIGPLRMPGAIAMGAPITFLLHRLLSNRLNPSWAGLAIGLLGSTACSAIFFVAMTMSSTKSIFSASLAAFNALIAIPLAFVALAGIERAEIRHWGWATIGMTVGLGTFWLGTNHRPNGYWWDLFVYSASFFFVWLGGTAIFAIALLFKRGAKLTHAKQRLEESQPPARVHSRSEGSLSALRMMGITYSLCLLLLAALDRSFALFHSQTALLAMIASIALSNLPSRVKAFALGIVGWFAVLLAFRLLSLLIVGFDSVWTNSIPLMILLAAISLLATLVAHKRVAGRYKVSWPALGSGLLSWVASSSVVFYMNAIQYSIDYQALRLAAGCSALFLPFTICALIAMTKSTPSTYAWGLTGISLGFISFVSQASLYSAMNWDAFAYPFSAFVYTVIATVIMVAMWLFRGAKVS